MGAKTYFEMESQSKFRTQWKLTLVKAPLLQLTLLTLVGQWNGSEVKALTQKPGDQSSLPKTHENVAGENHFHRVVLCPLHIYVLAFRHMHVPALKHKCTHSHNNKVLQNW